MDYRKKIFVNRYLTDDEVALIKKTLYDIDFESYLKDSFIYVNIYEDDILEIYSVEDRFVFLVSKEFNITNKMAVEYLKYKIEIEQELNEILYWNNINNVKKYIPVVSDKKKKKIYGNAVVYAENITEAIKTMDDIYIDDYLYIVDVDEEI